MFIINYKISKVEYPGIGNISDEEIRYNFLLGSVRFFSSDAEIGMQWDWIPLLDFAYCLQVISNSLKSNGIAKECFEFTENAETLEFLREREQVKIIASFCSTQIETRFVNFEKGVRDFHVSISEFIRMKISNDPPDVLQKYLSSKSNT